MAKQSLGEFLALLRKANGYTQQDVADKLNISNRTLSSWETDRTIPDILILPALADLYGVTVDELLRGEKTQPEKAENIEYSNNTKRSIRKNRYGKFCSKYSMLTGLVFTFEGILILAGILHLFAATPLWADILLTVVCAIGIAVCIVLVFYFANGLKHAEGVILKEDLTEDNKAFILAVRHKCGKFIAAIAFPFFGFALLLTFLLLFDVCADSFLGYYAFIVILNAALGIIALASYGVYNGTGFKRLANDGQITNYNANKKLIIKLCCFGLIPVIVFGILAIIFQTPVISYRHIYQNEDYEDFKCYMQTIVITQTDEMHTVDGAPTGEYLLEFPENADFYIDYDLGNNFCGEVEAMPTIDNGNYEKVWVVHYRNGKDEYYIKHFIEYKFYDGSEEKIVVNARFEDINLQYIDYIFSFGTTYDEINKIILADEKFTFCAERIIIVSALILGVFIVSIYASAAVCFTIYFVKRKKQDYSF